MTARTEFQQQPNCSLTLTCSLELDNLCDLMLTAWRRFTFLLLHLDIDYCYGMMLRAAFTAATIVEDASLAMAAGINRDALPLITDPSDVTRRQCSAVYRGAGSVRGIYSQ